MTPFLSSRSIIAFTSSVLANTGADNEAHNVAAAKAMRFAAKERI
jgi:hypothetical protein